MSASWKWSLGTGRSTMSAVYGSRIPLSTTEEDVEVKVCPCCGGDLDPLKHRPVHPGEETFFLANGWANALLRAWKAMDPEDKANVRRPSMACAAWASYEDDAGGQSGDYFCLAGTSEEVAPSTQFGGRRSTTVQEFCSCTPVLAWPDVDGDTKILFAGSILDSEGAEKTALELLGSSCLKAMEDRRKWALGHGRSFERERDPDGGWEYGLLKCTEQRVLLAHRLVMTRPQIVCPSGSGFTFTLKRMTVALADDQSDDQSPYAIWYGENHGECTPAPPCDTCRAVLPALLCGLAVEEPSP